MLEYLLILLLAIPVMAAKRRKRRRNSNFVALPVDVSLALGTLGSGTVIASAMTNLGQTRFRVISVDILWSMRGLTAGEGPLEVGIANNNLSVTEIGEMLDASPTSQTDIIAMERLRRPVRNSGVFAGLAANEALNDGRKMRTKLSTVLNEGVELAFYVRNKSGSALTTGGVIQCTGKVYGIWI